MTAALTAVMLLPSGLELVFRTGSSMLLARARSTPLILAPPGSAVDQVLSALYFERALVSATFSDIARLSEAELGEVVPIYARFRARGAPVVGTTVDYFDLRALRVGEGQMFSSLGEAVVGARLAGKLNLAPGASLVTEAESPFDLTASLPLELHVSGVLAESGGPDDDAIFVDLKTSWVIQGLGHGHEATDPTNPVPKTHRRITAANASSFHFHGDRGSYPVTAGLVWPRDDRARALLRARYDERDPGAAHLVAPEEVMQRLLQKALRLERLLLFASSLVGLSSLALLGLVVSLSLALRRRELESLARIGVSRAAVIQLVSWELAFMVAPALILTSIALGILAISSESLWITVLRAG